ncbi:hypothetical protein DDW44_31210 [Streptomyces tirandamycinicus]|uniref:Uncharacterized protein n=1 Tax=Streptomyces tirandamycinicus TaxID=2174846 RepID=A0A2S1T3L5_9ACTN|nr:hypothetical protein DDW44_31210 [Streptomyces tirandamycinicus]
MPPSPDDTSRAPLLSAHSALVLTIAVIIGVGIGCLTYLGTRQVSTATIAGLTAFGVSVPVLRREIGS